jgi:histidine kinase
MRHEFPGYQATQQLYASLRSSVEQVVRIADGAVLVLKQPLEPMIGSEALRRVQQEYAVLTELRGPGVVAAHALVRDAGRAGIVLENAGESLASWLAREGFSLLDALGIGVEVARTLARIHELGIIHKDINPNNIAYDCVRRVATVIDFDIASRAHRALTDLPTVVVLEGTLAYIAPEQTGRLKHAIDGRSDLYSLGATLYELFTGRPPFDGTDDLALVHAHLATQPARIDQIDPAIPPMIAEIIVKLLEKSPEQRYQTGHGLAADLAECQRQLAETGWVEPFPIAQRDASPRFGFADRLYGRDPEIRALLEAFARTTSGAVEVVVVTGPAGVGKSALARELFTPVTEQRGYFTAGKFDQLQRDIPYSAVARSLGELVAQILTDPALDRWRVAIAAALGDDAGLVAVLLPLLGRVVGELPPAPELSADAAQRRLASALTRLVQVFARKAHPLVMFFDDMQWADVASLNLMSQIATSGQTESLLLIEASRECGSDAIDPFASALREQERRGVTISRLVLAPLSAPETAELVGDALRRPPEHVTEVADRIWHKTHGNVFFIRQFLQALYDEGVIAFDAGSGAFELDVEAIDRARITDNVADLLAHALARLPAPTRDVLVVAAAIGGRFEVSVLAIAADCSELAAHDALGPAVAAGLIVPAGRIACTGEDVGARSHFMFQHDRVQQAAYEVSSGPVRERLHLSIGRHLLASVGAEGLADRLFDIVHHLNHGRALISDEIELARFVELAIAAAGQARRAGAFDVAATMLRSVCASRTWADHYAISLRGHIELVEVLTLAGLPHEASEVVRAAESHVAPRDRATFEALDATICNNLGRMVDSMACTRRGAALVDVDLPTDPAAIDAAVGVEIGAITTELQTHPVETWMALPTMCDPDRREAMRLLAGCIPPAYQAEPQLLALICAKMVTLSLRHGNCEESARGYATFAVVLWAMGQFELAFRFGKLGIDLVSRAPDHPIAPSVSFTFAAFASPWQQPLEASIEDLRAIMARAVDVGDLTHAGYGALFVTTYGQVLGLPLRELLDEVRRNRTLCIRLGLDAIPGQLALLAWHLRTLMGIPPGAGEDDFEYAVLESTVAAQLPQAQVATFRLNELERRFWRDDFEGVVDIARQIAPALPSLAGNPMNAEFRFYACLANIAVGNPAEDFEPMRAELARYAEVCSHNYGPMVALVEAELARVRGDVAGAMAHYDAAIDGAAAAGSLKVEILGHQLAAQWWLARDRAGFAALHLAEARDRSELWGAHPHARALELRARELGGTVQGVGSTHSRPAVATTLDFATVVKASNTLANDLVLDSLLAKIMAIIVENTGAQSGAIVLESGGELLLHVSWQGGRAVTVPGGVALAAARDLPEGIIRYVTRTAEHLVLDDASRHPTFRAEPYVRERRPRSVLCMPIVHNEGVLGAVYLENNLLVAAFTLERLEALGIILSQLAISIENALMFTRLAAYRDHLEDLVAKRTTALTQANDQLREQALIRERMESELRLAQKLQSVGQLAAGVAHEINTPIQYIGDSIAFLTESFGTLGQLVDAYRASIDIEHGQVDVVAIRRADEDADMGYLRENVPEACALALHGVKRVAKIVQAMRAFSYPDQSVQEATSLNAALENTLAVARSEYSNVADIETSFGEIPEVVCYIGEINQVFLNLIVNAAHAITDAVKDSGQRGTITITTRSERGDAVLVTIADTGTGIPATIQDRVFDPFFTTKPVGKGTGQGLALARTAIVDRHAGTISFETRQGQGTTFFVRLPIHGRAAAALRYASATTA